MMRIRAENKRPFAWLNRVILLGFAAVAFHVGATKNAPSGGGRAPPLLALPPPVVDQVATNDAPSALFAAPGPATNLCFLGIWPCTTSVWLRVGWPVPPRTGWDALDCFARLSLATNAPWSAVAEIPVDPTAGESVFELPRALLPEESTNAAFFAVAYHLDTDGDGLLDSYERFVAGTDPDCADTDGDGLADGDEIDRGTDPLGPDSDGDGLPDGLEISLGTDPASPDTDGDGIPDVQEARWIEEDVSIPWFDMTGAEVLVPANGNNWELREFALPFTNRLAGLTVDAVAADVNGVLYLGTPLSLSEAYATGYGPDLSDWWMVSTSNFVVAAYWTWLEMRSDSRILRRIVEADGVRYCVIEYRNVGIEYDAGAISCQIAIPDGAPSNTVFVSYGSVADGRTDEWNIVSVGAQGPQGSDIRLSWACSHPPVVTADRTFAFHFGTGGSPILLDTDDDGADDALELAHGTCPWRSDTDGDGLTDGWEIRRSTNPLLGEGDDGRFGDPDGDGLVNFVECRWKSDPHRADTDGDGLSDIAEVGGTFATNALPWLAFDTVTNLTAAFPSADDSIIQWSLPMPIVVQGETVTNATLDVNGIICLNRPGFAGPASSRSPTNLIAWTPEPDALILAPFWMSGLFISTDEPGATRIRAGTASCGNEGYLLVEYENIYRNRYWTTNAVSFQVAIPTNGTDRAFVRYCDLVDADGDMGGGVGPFVGLQGLDGRTSASWDDVGDGCVADGLAVLFAFGTGTNPTQADTDGDGLDDPTELALGTDPHQPDTDGDGMDDGWECDSGFNPFVHNSMDANPDNDADVDLDGDGLTNLVECENGTNPNCIDTDGDGVNDRDELLQDSDPADTSDGGRIGSRVPFSILFGDHSTSHSEKYLLEVLPVANSGPAPEPRSFSLVNQEYGRCETRDIRLKPGWKYVVRLSHAGTDPETCLSEPDYDYTLDISDGTMAYNSPADVFLDDPQRLFGVDETSYRFGGEEKEACLYVLGEPRLVFDYDRDGKIDDDDVAKAKAGTVFRFWINDDNDEGDVCEAEDYNSDFPGKRGVFYSPNHSDAKVNGRRDLVDFTPVWIDISDVFPRDTPQFIRTNLKWHLHAPCVNVVWTAFTKDSAGAFQREGGTGCGPQFNQQVHEAAVEPLSRNPDGKDIPTAFAVRMAKDANRGIFLIEGVNAQNVLEIQVRDESGDVIVFGEGRISIDSVENMYRWLNLRNVCGRTDGLASRLESPNNRPDAECDDRNFVFVHGFNVNVTEARSSAAEVFKRLWQSGLSSMFTAVDWFGDDEQFTFPGEGTLSANYYANALHAFESSPSLAYMCNYGLPGRKVMLAHSLGNMLVSSAAVDHLLNYDRYYMLNAAVAMEAYDTNESSADMIDPDWTNGVPVSCRASHWNELFAGAPDDFRSSLSWRGRFAGITNVVNCYSETEDVVGNPKEEVGLLGYDAWKLKQTAWVKQELMKGTSLVHAINILPWSHIGCEGGWGINAYYSMDPRWYFNGFTSNVQSNMTRQLAIEHPLFTPFREMSANMHATNLFTFAAAEASPNLRARFLGDAIPAESHAVGANPVRVFGEGKNVSLMSLASNNQNWPKNRTETTQGTIRIEIFHWHHSDLKNLAYYYVHKLFDLIVSNTQE